jgi:hypothetical protein
MAFLNYNIIISDEEQNGQTTKGDNLSEFKYLTTAATITNCSDDHTDTEEVQGRIY